MSEPKKSNKGNFYEVLHVAIHSETLEQLAVYKPFYEDPPFLKGIILARPLDQFIEQISVDDKCVPIKKLKLGKYQHYEGKFYEVLHVALRSDTLENLVIYKPLYEDPKFVKDPVFARPFDMFVEEILVGTRYVPRFKYLGD